MDTHDRSPEHHVIPVPAGSRIETGDPSIRTADEVAGALGADLTAGLSSHDASKRLATNGPNELRAAQRIPAWRRVLSQFQDPLIYLLLVAIAISLGAWGFDGFAGWPVDAMVIAAIVLLNGVLGDTRRV